MLIIFTINLSFEDNYLRLLKLIIVRAIISQASRSPGLYGLFIREPPVDIDCCKQPDKAFCNHWVALLSAQG